MWIRDRLQRNDSRFQSGGFNHGLHEEVQLIKLAGLGCQKFLLLLRRNLIFKQRVVDHFQDVYKRQTVPCHGAFAFPGGSRLPHGRVPACSKHRTGTARHSHCGGSYPSFHPLSWGNEVGFSLSANKMCIRDRLLC